MSGMKREWAVRILTDAEMARVSGGWHPFPRGIFGRDGKPFFGKDLVKGAQVVVAVAPAVAPFVPVLAPLTPWLTGVAAAQQLREEVIARNKRNNK